MIKLLKSIRFVIILSLIILSPSICSATSFTSHPEVRRFIDQVVNKYGISSNYVRWVLNKAHYNPEIIQRMDRPYEAMPWDVYQRLFLTPDRIANGARYWSQSNRLLAWEERQYQVPAKIIVAIIGIESEYGVDMGHYKVLDSLSTLAFYYPPRADFFQKELAAFIALTHLYKIQPDTIEGSYAGAMGQPQFMPSSMLYYAVDFHDKDKPNIFSDKADVIFSVGNYLRQNGWEPDEPIATPARVIGSRYQEILKRDSRIIQIPKLSLAQLTHYGVYPADGGKYNSSLKANLIELQGIDGPQFWLTFYNFYVITTYNNSDLYAMAAYQLGNKIEQAYYNQVLQPQTDQQQTEEQQQTETNASETN